MIRDGKSNKDIEEEQQQSAALAASLLNQGKQFQQMQRSLLEAQVKNYAYYAETLSADYEAKAVEKLTDNIPVYDISKPVNLKDDYPFEFHDAGEQTYFSEGKLVAASLLKLIAMITDNEANKAGISSLLHTFGILILMLAKCILIPLF